jgi:GTP cyclohydrolase IA
MQNKLVITEAQIVGGYYELLGGNHGGVDPETIRRVSDFTKEFTAKRQYERMTTFPAEGDDLVMGKHLRLFSFCEHHLLPFFGEVHLAYIPDRRILGLSKVQRLIDRAASKPSLQERLTKEIADEVERILRPKGIAVLVKAIHSCVFARGVQSAQAEFETIAVRGVFRDKPAARAEFLSRIPNHRVNP